jgi:hypothetical protein
MADFSDSRTPSDLSDLFFGLFAINCCTVGMISSGRLSSDVDLGDVKSTSRSSV